MDELPADTIYVIFEFLTRFEILKVGQASKGYYVSVLARNDRLWKDVYETFVKEYCPVSELPSKKQKIHDHLPNYFEKYKFLKVLHGKNTGYIFSSKLNCWVQRKKFHCIDDVVLQNKIICRDIKAVFVGDDTVGKTSLLIRYCQNKFVTKYRLTIYENKVSRVRFNERMVSINLWDTTGHDDYAVLRPLSYQDTDCFVIVYDISNPTSLKNSWLKWHGEICVSNNPKAGIVLCGAKRDLRDDINFHKEIEKNRWKRIMTTQEGLENAKKMNADIFLETSSKNGYNCGHRTGKLSGIENAILFSFIMKSSKEKFIDDKESHIMNQVKKDDQGKCQVM